jgi:hypothetical protein
VVQVDQVVVQKTARSLAVLQLKLQTTAELAMVMLVVQIQAM